MTKITVTDFARNMSKVLDWIEHNGEEIVVIRNNHEIARILSGSSGLTATEAMSDIYSTLSDDAAADWLKESNLNHTLKVEKANKWDT